MMSKTKKEWHGQEPLQVLSKVQEHAQGGPDVCFIIHRSSNSNVVTYKGDSSEGMRVFWIMYVVNGLDIT